VGVDMFKGLKDKRIKRLKVCRIKGVEEHKRVKGVKGVTKHLDIEYNTIQFL